MEAKDSFLAIDAAHMVAVASATLEEKLKWNNRGLEQAKEAKDAQG